MRMRTVLVLFTAVACLTLVGCDETTMAPGPTDTVNPDDPPDTTTTYYEHVAPIFKARCWGCHTEGGVAPFALDNYEEADAWAEAALAATHARTMPPQAITADGSCGEWYNDGWLSDEELQTIADWVDEGAAAGDPSLAPEPRAALSSLDDYDIEFSVPTDYEPEASGQLGLELDDYRCFVFDPEIDENTWITGYEVMPGNPELVHHVLGFTVSPERISGFENGEILTNQSAISNLQEIYSDRPGWYCAPLAGENVVTDGMPVAWAPGQGPLTYPDGLGIQLKKDHLLVFQFHYNLVNGTGQDNTRVRLKIEDTVERPAMISLMDEFLFSVFVGETMTLEPGEKELPLVWTIEVDEILEQMESEAEMSIPWAEVYGTAPHMHGRGVSQTYTLLNGDDSESCLAEVKSWDYNWQFVYWSKTPTRITAGEGERIRVECIYDTSNESEIVYPGFGTQDEMCLLGLTLALPSE